MSLKKHQVWAMMPLLGILFMSPDDVSVKYGRHIASQEPVPESQEQQPQVQNQQPQVEQPQVVQQPEAQQSRTASQTPKLDALLAGREIPSREIPVGLTANAVKEQITGVLSRAETATERTNDAAQADMAKLDEVKAELIASAIELRQIENLIPSLSNSEESEDLSQRISQAKVQLEGYIGDYEGSLAIVAARQATPTPEVTTPGTPDRAPSVVTEETTPETAPSTAETKPEVKPETKPEAQSETEEKDPILCALEEQNKLLQTQLQTMIQQQSMIMQAMMQLTQSMMLQNMYNVRDTFNYQQAYQYHQPQVAGNWVYYPNGLQPIQPGQTMPGQPDQSSIFGTQQPQPQFNPYMMGQQQQQFPFSQPGMMNQGGMGMWGLQPQMQFQHNPGNFGMDALGFNFGNSPVAPSQQSPMFNSGFQFI